MATAYTPGLLSQSLFGSKQNEVDAAVDELFKNSAGPSKVAASTSVQLRSTGESESDKADAAKRALEAVSKAKSIVEIISEKKKEKKV